jgi:tetratricopeptide (TPR) repeat protein
MTVVPLQQALIIAGDHHRHGRLAEAQTIYARVLEKYPGDAAALEGLGAIALAQQNFAQAQQFLEAALRKTGPMASSLNNLGLAFRGLGRGREAADCFQRSLALDPNSALTLMNLGQLLEQQGRLDDGLALLQRAAAVAGANSGPFNALGNLLARLSRFEEAERAFRHALSLDPGNSRLLFNLANLYLKSDRLEDAVATYRASIAADPDYFDPYHNLGHTYNELGQPADAEACFRKGMELRPDDFNPHMSLGMTLIAQGRYQEGWREYQWRLHDKVQLPPRGFAQPAWQGESLAGKRLLLCSEQGAGDAIMFTRYLPLLLAQGATVIVECLAPLKRLFENIAGPEQVVLKGQTLPPFDVHVAPIDLPLYFNTTVDTVPNQVPYLPWPTPEQDQALQLGAPSGRRIGLIWAGNPNHRHDKWRSFHDVKLLAPLFDVPNTVFYNLQYGARGEDFDQAGLAHRIVRLGDERIVDFWNLAGFVRQMDLVISVDTAVCHLAGALGVPTWTLLAYGGEWRWMTGREDTPWYPTMRLFRQKVRGDWSEVIQRVAMALRARP